MPTPPSQLTRTGPLTNYDTPFTYGAQNGIHFYGSDSVLSAPARGDSDPNDPEKWIPFFGQPQRQPPANPYNRYRRELSTLPEAYKGKNPMLEEMMVTMVSEADQWAIKEWAPWQVWNDGMSIKWNVTTFDQTGLDRVPALAAGRLLTSRTDEREGHMQSWGKSMLLERGFMHTERGRQTYRANVLQIASATVETFCHNAMFTTMNVPASSAYSFYQSEISVRPGEAEEDYILRLLQEEHDMFGVFHKSSIGLETVLGKIQDRISNRVQQPADYVILPQGSQKYIDLKPEKRYYFLAGPGTGKNILPEKTRRSGMTIRESRGFRIGEDQPAVDPQFSHRTIGGFFTFQDAHLRHIPMQQYQTSMMDMRVYDERLDRRVRVSYRDYLLHGAGLFRIGADGTRWEWGELAEEIIALDGDVTVGDIVRQAGHIDRTVERILTLPGPKLVEFLREHAFAGEDFEKFRTTSADSSKVRADVQQRFKESLLWNVANLANSVYSPLDSKGGPTGTTTGRPEFDGDAAASPPMNLFSYQDGDGKNPYLVAAVSMVRYEEDRRRIISTDYTAAFDGVREIGRTDVDLQNAFGKFAKRMEATQKLRNADTPLETPFGVRWATGRTAPYPSRAPKDETGQIWFVNMGGVDWKQSLTSHQLAVLASSKNVSDMDYMVVVGAPMVQPAHKDTPIRPRNISPFRLDAADVSAPTLVARVLGDLIYIAHIMRSRTEEDLNERSEQEAERPNILSMRDLWRGCVANVATIREARVSLAKFDVHPVCYAWKPTLDALKEMLLYNTAEEFDRFILSNTDGAREKMFNGKPAECKEEVDTESAKWLMEGRFDRFLQERTNFLDETNNRDEAVSGQDMHFVAGQVSEMEIARALRWARENKNDPEKMEQGRLFESHALNQYIPSVFNLTPSLYRMCPNVMRSIFRKCVLQTSRGEMGYMTTKEYIKIMFLVEQAWKEMRKAHGDTPFAATRMVSAFLAELYANKSLDITAEMRKKHRDFSARSEDIETPEDVARNIDFIRERDDRNGIYSQFRTVMETIKHLSEMISWLSFRYFQYRMLPTHLVKEFMTASRGRDPDDENDDASEPGDLHLHGKRSVQSVFSKIYKILWRTSDNAGGSKRPHRTTLEQEFGTPVDPNWPEEKKKEYEQNVITAMGIAQFSRHLKIGKRATPLDAIADEIRGFIDAKDVEDILNNMVLKSADFFRFALDNHFPPYIHLDCFRPHQTYEMGTVMGGLGWGGSSNTFAGREDFTIGENVTQKLIFGNFTMLGATLVTRPEAITHVRDVLCRQYIQGNSLQVFNPNEPRDRSNYLNGLIEKDVFVCASIMDPLRTKEMRVMDITGRYNPNLGGVRQLRGDLHHPRAEVYSQFWGWSNGGQAGNFLERPLYDRTHRRRMNTLVWEDHQERFRWKGGVSMATDYVGVSGVSGDFGIIIQNSGPWGHVYDGVGKVRRGLDRYMEKPNYDGKSSTVAIVYG